MAYTLRIKDHWAEQRLFLHRIIVSVLIVVVLMALVAGRLTQLQVFDYEYFSAQSQGNRIRLQAVPPTRGLIFDRNGKILAENLPTYQLELIPEQVPDIDDALARLGALGLIEPDNITELKKQIDGNRRFDSVPVRLRLSDEEVARFAVKRLNFPGIEIRARLSRNYPYGGATAHALGYMGGISSADKEKLSQTDYAGTSHIGKISIERAYENELHGTVGTQEVLVNARGRIMQVLGGEPATPGQDLILTLDIDAQLAAQSALEGRRGAVVAIDPSTGEVLVFSSSPTFDPNTISVGLSHSQFNALQGDPSLPLFNRALRGSYPPGSTIKPILALAAIHDKTVDPEHQIMCRGYFSLPGKSHRYRDWKRGGHGLMNLNDAIAQSCDTYFYSLAVDMGIDRMQEILEQFGLGAVTGIDVGGEKPGLVPSRAWKQKAFSNPGDRVWFPGETVITGIGQGYLLVTPLQLAQAVATIAAHGKRFRPHLLHATRDPVSGSIYELPEQPLDPVPVPDDEQWEFIVSAMHAVMSEPRGTARAVSKGAPFMMAGKSGTAQVFSVGQEEEYNSEEIAERMRDHALFIAFAPLENPRIAVAVIVENGESGSGVAAPVARRVMEAYLGNKAAGTGSETISSTGWIGNGG